MSSYAADIVIFGGGIAGLWTLAQLRRLGYATILLETRALGGVQTLCSQGIIHGGTKYALGGKMTAASKAIGEMPGIWHDCLAGKGEIDLSDVKVLAKHQHLWSTESLLSKMTGFFAGKAMRSRMATIPSEYYPSVFQHPDFKGTIYQLDEPVLDVQSLTNTLIRQLSDYCYLIEPDSIKFASRPEDQHVMTVNHGLVKITASRLVLAAGSGNADLLSLLGLEHPIMQSRPLHMTLLRGDLPPIYAHCLGASAMPRLTITSYQQAPGKMVWYLGGDPAEKGVALNRDEQIMANVMELREVLPWFDFSDVEWATRRVNRAEIAQPKNKRPDEAYVGSDQGVITVWPTKLAFAPMVATRVIDALFDEGIEPMNSATPKIVELNTPKAAQSPWDQVATWS